MFDVAYVVSMILNPAYLAFTLEETAEKHTFFKSGVILLYGEKQCIGLTMKKKKIKQDICFIRVKIATAK